MDLNVLIPQITAIITASLALVSPWIIAIINHKHEEKMHKLKFYEEHKAEVIENFLRKTGAYIYSHNWDKKLDIGEYSGEIYLYVDQKLWNEIDKLLELTYQRNHDEKTYLHAKHVHQNLCKELKQYAPRPKQEEVTKKHRKIIEKNEEK